MVFIVRLAFCKFMTSNTNGNNNFSLGKTSDPMSISKAADDRNFVPRNGFVW